MIVILVFFLPFTNMILRNFLYWANFECFNGSVQFTSLQIGDENLMLGSIVFEFGEPIVFEYLYGKVLLDEECVKFTIIFQFLFYSPISIAITNFLIWLHKYMNSKKKKKKYISQSYIQFSKNKLHTSMNSFIAKWYLLLIRICLKSNVVLYVQFHI